MLYDFLKQFADICAITEYIIVLVIVLWSSNPKCKSLNGKGVQKRRKRCHGEVNWNEFLVIYTMKLCSVKKVIQSLNVSVAKRSLVKFRGSFWTTSVPIYLPRERRSRELFRTILMYVLTIGDNKLKVKFTDTELLGKVYLHNFIWDRESHF